MLERAAQLRFTLQAFVELVRLAVVVEFLIEVDGLERDLAADAAVTREIHHSHRAAPEFFENFITTDFRWSVHKKNLS